MHQWLCAVNNQKSYVLPIVPDQIEGKTYAHSNKPIITGVI